MDLIIEFTGRIGCQYLRFQSTKCQYPPKILSFQNSGSSGSLHCYPLAHFTSTGFMSYQIISLFESNFFKYYYQYPLQRELRVVDRIGKMGLLLWAHSWSFSFSKEDLLQPHQPLQTTFRNSYQTRYPILYHPLSNSHLSICNFCSKPYILLQN